MDTSGGNCVHVRTSHRSRQKQLGKVIPKVSSREICMEASGYPERRILHVGGSSLSDEDYLRELAAEDPVRFNQMSRNVHELYMDRQFEMYRQQADVKRRQQALKRTAVNKLLEVDHSVVDAVFSLQGSSGMYKEEDVVSAAVKLHLRSKDRLWKGLDDLYHVERNMAKDGVTGGNSLPLTIDTDAYRVAVEYEGEEAGRHKGNKSVSTVLYKMKENGVQKFGRQRKIWGECTATTLQADEPPVVKEEDSEQLGAHWPASMSLNNSVPQEQYKDVYMREAGKKSNTGLTKTPTTIVRTENTESKKKDIMKIIPSFKPRSLHQAYTEHFATHSQKVQRKNTNQKKLLMAQHMEGSKANSRTGSRAESHLNAPGAEQPKTNSLVLNASNRGSSIIPELKLEPSPQISPLLTDRDGSSRMQPQASPQLTDRDSARLLQVPATATHQRTQSRSVALVNEPGLSPLMLTRRASIITSVDAAAPPSPPPKPVIEQQFQHSTISSRAKMIEKVVRTRQETISLADIPLSYINRGTLASAVGIDNKPRLDYRESVDFVDIVVELTNYICIWVNFMQSSARAEYKVKQGMLGLKQGYSGKGLPPIDAVGASVEKKYMKIVPPPFLLTTALECHSLLLSLAQMAPSEVWVLSTLRQNASKQAESHVTELSDVETAGLIRRSVPPALLTALSQDQLPTINVFALQAWFAAATLSVDVHEVVKMLFSNIEHLLLSALTRRSLISHYEAATRRAYVPPEPVTLTHLFTPISAGDRDLDVVNILHEQPQQQFQLNSSLSSRVPSGVGHVNLDLAPFTTDLPFVLPGKNRVLNAIRQDVLTVIDPYDSISQEAQQLRRNNAYNVTKIMLMQVDPQLRVLKDLAVGSSFNVGNFCEHVMVTPHTRLGLVPELLVQPDDYVPVSHEYKRGELLPTTTKHLQKAMENSHVMQEIKELEDQERAERPSLVAQSRDASRSDGSRSSRPSLVLAVQAGAPKDAVHEFQLQTSQLNGAAEEQKLVTSYTLSGLPETDLMLETSPSANVNVMEEMRQYSSPSFDEDALDSANISIVSSYTPIVLNRAHASRPVTPALSTASRVSSSIRLSVNKRSFQALPGLSAASPNPSFDNKQLYATDVDTDEVLLPLSPNSRNINRSARSSVSGSNILLQSSAFDVSSGNTTWDVSLMAEYIEKHLGTMQHEETLSEDSDSFSSNILNSRITSYRSHASILQQYTSVNGYASFRGIDHYISPIMEDPEEPNLSGSNMPIVDTTGTASTSSGIQTARSGLSVQPPSPSAQTRSDNISPTISSPRTSRVRRATQTVQIEEARTKVRKQLEMAGHLLFSTDTDCLHASTIASVVEAGGSQHVVWILSHIVNARKTVSTISELQELVRYTREQRQNEEDSVYSFLQAASLLQPTSKNSTQAAKQIVDCVGLDAMTTLRQAGNKMLRNLSGTTAELVAMLSQEQQTLGFQSVYIKASAQENRVGSMLRSDAIKQEALSHTYERKIEAL